VRSLISGDVNITAAEAVTIMGGGGTGEGVTITNAPSTNSLEATINIVGQDNNSTSINSSGGRVSISGGNYTGTGTAAGQDGGSIELKGGDTSNTGSTSAGGDIFIEPGENTGGGGGPDGEIFFRRQINDGTGATNPSIQFGQDTATVVNSGPGTKTIFFPVAFSSAPRVVTVTFHGNPQGIYQVTNITSTSFVIQTNASATPDSPAFSYIAIL
jgi:hypothetical protein